MYNYGKIYIKGGLRLKKRISKFLVLLLILVVAYTPISDNYINTITVEAHSGRTDSSGGHRDNKNKSGLGSYHYHCGGHPAHLHKNGVCPYSSSSSKTTNQSTGSSKKTTSTSSKSNKKKKDVSSDIVKKVQRKLNELGYDCGKPDGIMGKKTKAALKKYQKDNKLTVDGIIGNEVLKSLGISK